MTYEEALEVIKKRRGCIDNWDGVECLLREDCRDCQYYYDNSEYEEAMKVAIEALEKQIPRKPISRWTGNETVIECPNCKKYPFDLSEYQWARRFCGNCGKAIDWSDLD